MPQDLLRDLKAVKERGIKYDSLAFGSSNWVDGAAMDCRLGRVGFNRFGWVQ